MGILISSLYPNVVLVNGYVRMSFDLDDAIVEDWLTDVENVGHCQTFRTANPNDFKNSTFDALSFFLMGDWILPNVAVAAGLVKLVTLSVTCTDPFNTNISYVAYMYYRCRRTYNLMVISSPRKLSNRPFLSMMRIVKSVMLRAMIGR